MPSLDPIDTLSDSDRSNLSFCFPDRTFYGYKPQITPLLDLICSARSPVNNCLDGYRTIKMHVGSLSFCKRD